MQDETLPAEWSCLKRTLSTMPHFLLFVCIVQKSDTGNFKVVHRLGSISMNGLLMMPFLPIGDNIFFRDLSPRLAYRFNALCCRF